MTQSGRLFHNAPPTSHHQAQRITYHVPIVDASKYACYKSPIDLLWFFKSLPAWVNGIRMDKVSLLHG